MSKKDCLNLNNYATKANITLKDYRLLTIDEHKNLLNIRNKDEVREASLNQDMINLDNHLSWVENLKNDSTKEYFAIMYHDEIIGGINIFNISTKLKWGIFFEDNISLIIKSVIPIFFIDFIFCTYKSPSIYSEIKKANVNAISYNKNLGFKILEDKDIITMQLKEANYMKVKDSFLLKKIVKKMQLYNFKIKRYYEN